jgi:hypothetical protein
MKIVHAVLVGSAALVVTCHSVQASECNAAVDYAKSWKADDGYTISFRVNGSWNDMGYAARTLVMHAGVSFEYRVTWLDESGKEHSDNFTAFESISTGALSGSHEEHSGSFKATVNDKAHFSGIYGNVAQVVDVTVGGVKCAPRSS